MKTKKKLIFVALVLTLTLLACATANPLSGVPLAETGEVYGFRNGLWDGFTALFALIDNLFGGGRGIYEVHNNGTWYDAGFLLGVIFWGAMLRALTRENW